MLALVGVIVSTFFGLWFLLSIGVLMDRPKYDNVNSLKKIKTIGDIFTYIFLLLPRSFWFIEDSIGKIANYKFRD